MPAQWDPVSRRKNKMRAKLPYEYLRALVVTEGVTDSVVRYIRTLVPYILWELWLSKYQYVTLSRQITLWRTCFWLCWRRIFLTEKRLIIRTKCENLQIITRVLTMIFVNICPNARETRLKSTAKDRRLQYWVPLVLLLHNINCLLEHSRLF